jgi:hypothetical protein
VLAQNRDVPKLNGLLPVPLDVLVPHGPEFVVLRLQANEALRVQARPEGLGEGYPDGTLTVEIVR